MNLFGMITDGLGKIFGLVDDVHTSDEERLNLKQSLLTIQVGLVSQALEMEAEALKARAAIIEAEAKSEHWLTSTWRPITMLTFLVLVVYSHLFGVEIPNEMWTLLQLGLGGYVVGRSAEKIAPDMLKALKGKEEA